MKATTNTLKGQPMTDEVVVSVNGKAIRISQWEADEMESMGVEFAYLCQVRRSDGKVIVVSVPVN